MPQFCSAFRARPDTRPTADALIMRVGKKTNTPLIARLQGSGGADQFTRSATDAAIPVKPNFTKQKRRCYEQGLSAEQVNGRHGIVEKSDGFEGSVDEEVSGQEGQRDHDDQEIIWKGRPGPNVFQKNTPHQEASGKSKNNQCQPVGPTVG